MDQYLQQVYEHSESPTIVWMSMISAIIYDSPIFANGSRGWDGPRPQFFCLQRELFATAIPNFPVIGWGNSMRADVAALDNRNGCIFGQKQTGVDK